MLEPTAMTPLGYALLCEIRKKPRGGYALRLLFETTPLGLFSSSPGSIYPALQRLERQELIRAVGSGRGGRFEITPSGDALLGIWLSQPVTLADVSRRLELCLLRFAFLEAEDLTLAKGFLTSLESAAVGRATELALYLESEEGRALSLVGRLAVEHGLRSIEATRLWASDAMARFNPDPAR